ncbi:phenylalanine--tRNA ligase beta subunit, cytoplasmic-like [Histomonas meleagridis]|uniref:phenylalanine--tRNA ligase beta subunit, cytoplasmic-like n=1 Tax=Histomonas meleagridis TaxID=135588 RepID=UPI00355993A3|nr:phenylalanine--tRNA ligase beta subunit, cytoplasmic-like [Histomonas meleagridis]KAH0805898.1 phenylalanine--tRNA ligase beta subunit, cytoplasmic-like [Histomonas meleagridis]
MPIVSVHPPTLFKLMGVEPMTQEEVRVLLLRYGLELDDVITEPELTYKIDVPANRPDLLCVESIAIALKVFLGGEHPKYTIVPPKLNMTLDDKIGSVRPYIICAVLRNVTFTQESYQSFIDYQEKLHQSLCRRRKLASIGTHDLDKCKTPFTYTAEPPEQIKFVPLMGGEEVDGRQLFANLSTHQQLSKYLPLIENEKLWPVVRDGEGDVMSLPPIINSYKTRITLDTTNVFIECTAIDYTRANNAVIVICHAFSLYSKTPFTIEQVNVIENGKTVASPSLDVSTFNVDINYIRNLCGIPELTETEVISHLKRMMVTAEASDNGILKVTTPLSRSDILHPCDIAEDVAISYGYDNIAKNKTFRIPSGRALPINELTDRVRHEVSASLYNEILTFSLCSLKENFDMLCLKDDGSAVRISNAKTTDFEVVRTQLISGLLKVTRNIFDQPNIKKPLPLRLFEINDVCKKDDKAENNAQNERHFAASIADVKSRFEDIHGLLDRFFVMNAVDRANVKLEREDCPTCIPGQRAKIVFKGNVIGWIGVIHPQVLINFGLTTPIAAFEIAFQPFLEKQ